MWYKYFRLWLCYHTVEVLLVKFLSHQDERQSGTKGEHLLLAVKELIHVCTHQLYRGRTSDNRFAVVLGQYSVQ
jgi:hypothetical protein